MGTSRTDYLMWAVDVGAKAFDWDKHQAEGEGQPGRRFDIVYDGMSGQYCIAGKIVAVSHEHEGFSPKKISAIDLGVDRDVLTSRINDAFGMEFGSDDFCLILFSHYS